MSNEFPKSYRAPRPLAVRETYSRIRGSSSKSKTSTRSTSNLANPEYFAHLASHFTLKNDTRPGMVFEEAPRTKKLHNELQEDLSFLYQMREIWEAKLAQLEMDYDMLRDMSLKRPEEAELIQRQRPPAPPPQQQGRQQHQRIGVFNPAEHQHQQQEPVAVADNPVQQPTIITNEQPRQEWSAAAIDGQIQQYQTSARAGPDESPTGLLEDLEEFFPLDTDDDDDDRHGEGVNVEDDERARQALTLLLAEYGDEF